MKIKDTLNVWIIILGLIFAGVLVYKSLQEESPQEVIGVDRNEER